MKYEKSDFSVLTLRGKQCPVYTNKLLDTLRWKIVEPINLYTYLFVKDKYPCLARK